MQVPPLHNLMPKLQLCQRAAPTRVDVPNHIDIKALEAAAKWAKEQTCEICAGDLSKDTPDVNGDDTWRYAEQGPAWVAACDNQVREADGTLVYARHAFHIRCLQLHRRTLQEQGASPEVPCFGCQNPVVRFGKPDPLPDLDTRDPPNNEPEIPLVDRVKSMLLLFMELDNGNTRLVFSDRMVRDMEKLRDFPDAMLSEWAESHNIMFDSADLLAKTKKDSEAASIIIQHGDTLQPEVVPGQPPNWSLPLIDNSSGQAAYWVMVYKVAGVYWDFVTSNEKEPHQGYEIIASEEFAGLYPELHMVLTYIGAYHFWHHEIVVDVLKHWEEDLQKEENAAIRDSGEDMEHKMADLKAKRRMLFYNGTKNPDTGAFVMDPLAAFLQEKQPVLYKAVRDYFDQRGEQGSMNQFRDDDAPLQPGEQGYRDRGQELYDLLREQDQDVKAITQILEESRGMVGGPLSTQVDGEEFGLVTMAVARGNLEVVKAVLLAMDEEHNDDVDGQWVNMAGPNGVRPLHMAVEEFVMQGRSGLEIIKMLLWYDASLYTTSPMPRSTILWRTPRELAEGHAAAKSGLPTSNPGENAQEAAQFLTVGERVLAAARPGEGMADLHKFVHSFPTKAQALQMRRASQYTETMTYPVLQSRGPEEVNLHPKEFCDVVGEFWLEYMLLSGKAAPFKFQFSKTWDEMMWRFRSGTYTTDSITHFATFLANSSEESYPLHPSMEDFNTMPALKRRIEHSFSMRVAPPSDSEAEKMIRLIRQYDGASELRDMFAQAGPHEKNLANAYFRDAEMDKETPWLWTPLTYAIKIGAFEIMHMLLTEDKDFTVDANLASIAGSEDQARDADTLWRPLKLALEEARTTRRMGFEAIKLLMLHGANPHFPDYTTGVTILKSTREMVWSEDAIENARLVWQVESLLAAEPVIRQQPDDAMMTVPNPILRTTSDEELTMQQKSPVLLEFQNSFMSVEFQGEFLRAVDEVWRRYTKDGRFDRPVVWYEILLAIKNWNPEGLAGVNYEFYVRRSIRYLFLRAGFEERKQRDLDEEDANPIDDLMAAQSRVRDKAAAEAAAQRMEVDTDALRRDEREPNPVRRRSSRE